MITKPVIAFALFFCFFSTVCFAQTAPGGGFECPTSYSFKTNNGNGSRLCKGDAQVRVVFNHMPSLTSIPALTTIYYQGKPLPNIITSVVGYSITTGQGYINYCLSASAQKNKGNPFGNISPAIKLVLEFTYPDGMTCRTDVVY